MAWYENDTLTFEARVLFEGEFGEPYENRPTLAWVEFGADGVMTTHIIDVDEKFEDVLGQGALAYRIGDIELVDVNRDGRVDEQDGTHLLVNSLRRGVADVNLDGVFNRLDLISVLQAGKYGSTGAAAAWSQGDWNMDGKFDRLDLVLALQTDSYVG